MMQELLSKYKHNKHYLNRYIAFINYCQKRNNNLIHYETHHICPRSKKLFPEYEKLNEHPWNGCKMTYREHYITHWILSKVYTDKQQYSSMLKAFFNMSRISKSHSNRVLTSKMYNIMKVANSKAMRENNPMHRPEVVAKMRQSIKNFHASARGAEYRKMCSRRQTGINNITEKGYISLRARWIGVSRPKTPIHVENNRISQSKGIFKTPFGNYYSPEQAAQDNLNMEKLSRYKIHRYCIKNLYGFSFIPKIHTQT